MIFLDTLSTYIHVNTFVLCSSVKMLRHSSPSQKSVSQHRMKTDLSFTTLQCTCMYLNYPGNDFFFTSSQMLTLILKLGTPSNSQFKFLSQFPSNCINKFYLLKYIYRNFFYSLTYNCSKNKVLGI